MLLRRARRGALRKLGARFRRKPVLTEVAPSWPPVRHPFQVLMMAGCVWSGLFGMLGRGTPTSLARVLDFPVLFLWFAALVACGGLAVAAAITATRDQLWSMLLERLALFVVGPLALVYSVVLTATAGGAGVVAGAWAGGFGLACLVRGAQVQQSLSWLRWNRHRVESLTP
jgi:hypothetical protein